MQTQEAILERIKEREKIDFFGFETGDYVSALTFENAKEFLKEGVTSEQWKPEYSSRDEVIAKIKDYMPFAFEKANDKRGLSAMRSLQHMSAWTWLARDVELSERIMREAIGYGQNALMFICEFYGWDVKAFEN